MPERPRHDIAAADKEAILPLHLADARANVARQARLLGNDQDHTLSLLFF